MAHLLDQLIGPRVPVEELRAHRARYLTPTVIFMIARVLLLASIFLPYWHMELEAPQYPKGLFLTAYVNHLTGDVREIDGLNHYIGMRPLGEAAAFERTASIWAVIAMFLLVEGGMLQRVRSLSSAMRRASKQLFANEAWPGLQPYLSRVACDSLAMFITSGTASCIR